MTGPLCRRSVICAADHGKEAQWLVDKCRAQNNQVSSILDCVLAVTFVDTFFNCSPDS